MPLICQYRRWLSPSAFDAGQQQTHFCFYSPRLSGVIWWYCRRIDDVALERDCAAEDWMVMMFRYDDRGIIDIALMSYVTDGHSVWCPGEPLSYIIEHAAHQLHDSFHRFLATKMLYAPRFSAVTLLWPAIMLALLLEAELLQTPKGIAFHTDARWRKRRKIYWQKFIYISYCTASSLSFIS